MRGSGKTMCKRCQPDQVTKRCPTCKFCLAHAGCRCRPCGICGDRVGPKVICSACSACRKHHQGDGIPAGRHFPHRRCQYLQPRRVGEEKTTFLQNPLPFSMGVELELAECDLLRSQNLARLVPEFTTRWEHDGSVQPSGLELVTGPATGDTLFNGLTKLGSLVSQYAVANNTCGFHVHVDAAALSMYELRRLLIGWSIIEDQLFGPFVPQSRYSNVYCRPLCLKTPTILELLNQKTQGEIHNWLYSYLYALRVEVPQGLTKVQEKYELDRLKAAVDDCKRKKYMNAARRKTLNYHSWEMRGTVEFRLQAGTTDPAMILNWPLLCGYFVSKITAMTDKELISWVHKPPALSVLFDRWKLPKELDTWTRNKLKSWASNGR